MRYFTKEWYKDSLVADMCFQLRKTERAAVFSDAFFERLYAVEERAYLKFSKRAAKAYNVPFDKDEARAEFASNYKENLEFVKENLPDDILCDIKDMRVLALGSATHDLAMRITRFCGMKNMLCESIERSYDNESEAADEALGKRASVFVSLNGSTVTALSRSNDGDVSLSFSNPATENEISFSLINACLTDGDLNISDMTVVRHEILISPDNSGFEFSMLLMAKDASLHTISYTLSDISADQTTELESNNP